MRLLQKILDHQTTIIIGQASHVWTNLISVTTAWVFSSSKPYVRPNVTHQAQLVSSLMNSEFGVAWHFTTLSNMTENVNP